MRIAITIARQLGAGGAPLGQRLARRLNCQYYDNEIMRLAAEKLGADPEDLARWDEHRARFWERLSSTFSLGAPEGMFTPAQAVVIHDQEVFDLQSQVIREKAAAEDCVIIGRAAFWVLRDHPGRISVYLHSPAEARVPTVMDAFHVDAGRARDLIRQIDADRARFVRETTGSEITPRSQDLCIDTSVVPLDLAEEWIVQLAEARRKALPAT